MDWYPTGPHKPGHAGSIPAPDTTPPGLCRSHAARTLWRVISMCDTGVSSGGWSGSPAEFCKPGFEGAIATPTWANYGKFVAVSKTVEPASAAGTSLPHADG